MADAVKAGLRADFPELAIIGDPLFVIAFTSTDDSLDIFRVFDAMTRRGWALNGLHRPAAVHLCVTLRHTQPGVAERFLADLRDAIDDVRADPDTRGRHGPHLRHGRHHRPTAAWWPTPCSTTWTAGSASRH